MVFDEVDAGVGARVAGTVADKLAVTARGRQVLCVTHLAPIAARAGHHLLVAKAVRAGRTRAGVAVLSGAARVEEIARMLGGEAAHRHRASPRPGAARRQVAGPKTPACIMVNAC